MAFPALLLAGVLGVCFGCGPAKAPTFDKWVERAKQSYRTADFEDAKAAVEQALHDEPTDEELRLLGAKTALSRLDYAGALAHSEGLTGAEALGVRARAFWYSGALDKAADTLEPALRDPSFRDPWALQIVKLARKSSGRKPYTLGGAIVASVQMPKAGAAIVVPCELDGDHVFAMVSTANAEVMLDSNTRSEPAWVSFRFAQDASAPAIEVSDVPALTQDLSAVSRQMGQPIKLLLGTNFLRHVHATIDRQGDQFVLRRNEPVPPPGAVRLALGYARGGALLVRPSIGKTKAVTPAPLLVDTMQAFSVALEQDAWRELGVDANTLPAEPSTPSIRRGEIPVFQFAGLEVRMPAFYTGPLAAQLEGAKDLELSGIAGALLLAPFRFTFADGGRTGWAEPDATVFLDSEGSQPGASQGGAAPAAQPSPAEQRERAPSAPASRGAEPAKARKP